MQIIFHGKLAQEYGATHFIEANSVREALEAISRQLKIFSEIMLDRRPLLRVVGHPTQESLKEKPEKIDVVPAMIGGGGFAKIVIGSLLIVAGFVIPGAQFLIPMGISLVIGGISQLFIKAPSLSKEQDPDASKYLGLGNNTTKLGTLRSYSMGRVKVTSPHVIAVNVDSSDLVKGEFPV
jgi:predicted phage tail protein